MPEILAALAISLCFLIFQWFHFLANNKNHFWIILLEKENCKKLVFMWQDFVLLMNSLWSISMGITQWWFKGKWIGLIKETENLKFSPSISDLGWGDFWFFYRLIHFTPFIFLFWTHSAAVSTMDCMDLFAFFLMLDVWTLCYRCLLCLI